MEDYIIREIDRIGELLVGIACRLGLIKDVPAQCYADDITKELKSHNLDLDVGQVFRQGNPFLYLMETFKLTEKAVEAFAEIVCHTADIEESKKKQFLQDATQYLDSIGYFSFFLHSGL